MRRTLTRLCLTMLGTTAVAGTARSANAAPTAPAASVTPAAPAAAAAAAPATFTKDVAPILFENCTSCHRPGEVGPFSLLTYPDAKRRAKQIAEVTDTKLMPPWLPSVGHGQFMGERRLSEAQVKTLRTWADAGAPEGDAKDLPAAPKYAEGWALGEPDLVVKMPETYTLKAEGRDVFRVFTIPLGLTEDKYVSAVDFRPANRKIVHHALFFLDTSGEAAKRDAADSEPGYSQAGGLGFVPTGGLGGWAPGVTPRRLPEGVARIVRKGSDLVVQTHFHPSGKPEKEQSTIGLYFAKTEPTKLALSIPKSFQRKDLNIAVGERNFTMTDSFTLPVAFDVVGIFPHAHLLCKEIKVDATLPDGSKKSMIWIKDWDWNWQDEFLYDQNVHLPRGTVIEQKYVFDNSVENVRNPNQPPKRVTWGEQTADEMAITFFLVAAPKDALIFQIGGLRPGTIPGGRLGGIGGGNRRPPGDAPATRPSASVEPKKG
jgi:mono/diheme cytochrome c family protein